MFYCVCGGSDGKAAEANCIVLHRRCPVLEVTKRAESKQRSLSQVVALIVRKEFAPKEAKA